MSSISGVSQGGTQAAQQAQQYKASPAKAAASSSLEEANESAATTRQEAAKGDQVAIRRLARQHKPGAAVQSQPAQPAASAAPSPSQGKTAAGRLDVSA